MVSANLTRYLKRSAVAAALIAGLPLLWNYAVNCDVRINTSDTLYLKKMDGVLAHAQMDLSYSRGDIILEVTDPLGEGSRKYTDQGRDGTLDHFTIYQPLFQVSGAKGSFNYQEDHVTHAEIFAEENQRYQQHFREFAQKFPQDIKRMGLEKALAP